VLIVSAHNGYPHWVNSGADFIEVDIRRTTQGLIVLAHDVLQPNRRYVALDEVLDAAWGKIGLQFDLKEQGFEIELMERALDKIPSESIAVTTDAAESLSKIKERYPNVRTGLTRRHAEPTDADFLALDQAYVTEDDLDVGKPVWVWTVDNRRRIEHFMRDAKVAGIITNRPDRALKLRSARS
jgi:glycerophosphoryl diester phosphodiesterase